MGDEAAARRAGLVACFPHLDEVRRAIGNGTIDTLIAGDEMARQTFETFFVFGPIRVDWALDMNLFRIINGNHRIQLARELGLASLPASLVNVLPWWSVA